MVETPSSESSPNGGNNNKDNNYYLVILDLREELAQSKIVEYFGIDLRTNNIRIKLNGKYNHNSVISSFDLKDWRTTVNNLKTGLAEKDIDPIDIKNISNTFDDNNTKLTEAYFNAVKSREEENKRRAKEAAEEAEKEAKAASSFDNDLEMIKGNIVQTFVEETNRTVAIVQIDEHVENRFMDDGAFRQWIGTTYFKHAEEIRLQALESDDEYIPSVAASILSDEDKTKIQTVLMYEALGETYQRDKEYEQGFLADHRDGFEIDLRAICSKIDKSKDPDIFKPREKARIRLGLRCDARISYDPKDKEDNYVNYDLGDNTWSYIRVTSKHGVQLIRSTAGSPSPFKRYSTTGPQVLPNLNYDPHILEKFMLNTNVHKNKANRMLCEVSLISSFMMPYLPKPITVPNGPQGTGKSTFQEHYKLTLDPSSVLTVTAQSDATQAIQAMSHSYLTIFDNISDIKEWLSDLFCRVITGTAFSKRQLYTDDIDFIYKMIRAVGFNGLNVTATRADLLERILKIRLDPIDKDDREKLSTINKNFEDMLPDLLGFIFDTIHKVLLRIGEIDLKKNLPRMADWAELGELIARVLGYDDMEFMKAYNENLDLTSGEAIEANPVAVAITNFMEDQAFYHDSAPQLLAALEKSEGARGHSSMLRSKDWPKTGQQLTKAIDGILSNLKDRGIICDRKQDKHTKVYMITLVNQNWTPDSSSGDSGGKVGTGASSNDTDGFGKKGDDQ